jgi:hypothetical protein
MGIANQAYKRRWQKYPRHHWPMQQAIFLTDEELTQLLRQRL